MGLTSYSATYAFVYIQNEEFRVALLMPLLTLEMWQPVARTNADFIGVSEQIAARGTLETFSSGHNELAFAGIVVKPKLDRLDFYGVDFKDFAMRAEPRRLPIPDRRSLMTTCSTTRMNTRRPWTSLRCTRLRHCV